MGASQQGAVAEGGRWQAIPRTLSFVFCGGDVLLLKRSASKRVFPNQYNGLGGHVERGEDVYSGAMREIKEESGLHVHSLRLRGIHSIDAGGEIGILLFVFTAECERQELTISTSEGRLEWAPVDNLLEYDLVEDLPLLLPRILAMRDDQAPYFAHVSYDERDSIVMRFQDSDCHERQS